MDWLTNIETDSSADKAFKIFVKGGVPAENLVMGLPFYSRSWIMKSAERHGINMPAEAGI